MLWIAVFSVQQVQWAKTLHAVVTAIVTAIVAAIVAAVSPSFSRVEGEGIHRLCFDVFYE
jgi:uncharacterized membrane protein